MVKERNYLIETLKSSGIKSQVYTNMKKLKAGNKSTLVQYCETVRHSHAPAQKKHT